MVNYLFKENKISRIPETEQERYVSFYENSYLDDLEHCKFNLTLFPRWSIISGYYAMHDISKLFIAKVYRIKIDRDVHATTITLIKELAKDKEILSLIEKGYEEYKNLANELEQGKRERVKAQYYTGTEFSKERYKKFSNEFYNKIVLPYTEKIKKLIK
ncbi:MAG: hypothetical protein QW757_03945 [Candidatus Woesearchaeota archaeon]